MPKILECHSKGDRRFSALYAKLAAGMTVEQVYQNAKRDKDGKKFAEPKNKQATYLFINQKLERWTPELRDNFYKMLWKSYFDENPALLKEAAQYERYRDIFDREGGRVYTWADVEIFPINNGCAQSHTIAYLVASGNRMQMWPEIEAAYNRYCTSYRQIEMVLK